MLDASLVYSFIKGGKTYGLYVDSVRRRSEYWLEMKGRDGNVEISDKVYTWDEAVTLLENHEWTKYENHKIDISFADMIAAAKSRNSGEKVKEYNAQERVLEILKRLERNETIKMEEAKSEFEVVNATIQRDIELLRDFYQHTNKEIDYVHAKKGYELNVKGDYFTIDDCLIILLFLYGSRALNKNELKVFSDKMIGLFSKSEQIKLREFFQSYLYYYKPIQEQNLFDLFYSCFQAISEKRLLTFTYTNNLGISKNREVVPYTISYHDGKFYLLARIRESENEAPRSWQMDRIKNLKISNKKFSSPPSNLKVGEYVQRAVNMYGGEVEKVRLKVAASNLEFLKRKFPEVSISPSDEADWYDVRLEVLGIMGIELWVLQQGPNVEVLEPIKLRNNVKKLVGQMHQMYFAREKV
jgi:predicted DNA-binding transcriptional regulator YafY